MMLYLKSKSWLLIITVLLIIFLVTFFLYETNDESAVQFSIVQKESHVGHSHGPEKTGRVPDGCIKVIEGIFTQPLLCFEKESMVFTDSKGNQLYYQENSSSKPVVLLENKSVGNNVAWSKDCKTLYFKEKTQDYKVVIKSLNVLSKEEEVLENYPPLTELRSLAISDTIYFIDDKTLEVRASYRGKEWCVSQYNEKGNYYKILISPNNDYLVAHQGAFVCLFKTTGEFVRVLGKGIATDWNPNGKQLIGFLDETTNSHDISGSELYLFDIDSESPQQITFTPDAMEMWPIFKSKDEIIYTDQINKGIFIKKLKN